MKLRMMLCAAVLLLSGLVLAQSPDQQEDENVRGAFLTSRPKDKPAQSSPKPGPIRRPPRTAPTNASGPKATPSPTPTSAGVSAGVSLTVQPMGLGLTLYTRDANGLAVRVDPSHEF